MEALGGRRTAPKSKGPSVAENRKTPKMAKHARFISGKKYWQLIFQFYVPRLIALRGGDRNEETPTTENERGARTYTQPAQPFAVGEQLTVHTKSALWTGLMAPAWRLLHVSGRVMLDLTFLVLCLATPAVVVLLRVCKLSVWSFVSAYTN